MINRMLAKKVDGVKSSHCSQSGWLFNEGYYSFDEFRYCYYWYLRDEIMQEAQIYFQELNENIKSFEIDVSSIEEISVAADLTIGLLYFSIRKKRKEDLTFILMINRCFK